MAPIPLARLIVLQTHRNEEITRIGARIGQRAIETLNKALLQSRITTTQELWAESRKTHADIVLRPDAAENAYIIENRYAMMADSYENTLDVLLTALNNLPREDAPNPRRREREDEDHDDRPAKLPRLDLPTFSGKYEDWDSFSDIFTALVHNVPRIADTTKLQYLKSCLKDSAAELVKDVTVTGVNYASTWKALRDRFHNPRLTFKSLLDSLYNLPHLKKESALDLRSFIDEVQRIIRALTNLKAPVAHWDLLLVHLIEIRLDPESRKQWETELSARDRPDLATEEGAKDDYLARMPKFTDIAAFLDRRAQSLIVMHADKDDKRANPSTSATSSSRRVHHAQTKQPARSQKCNFCTSDHFTSRCPDFIAKDPQARKKAVRDAKLCFNCLGPHRRSACKSKYKCKKCVTEDHHTLLHAAFANDQTRASANAQEKKTETEVRTHVGRTAGGIVLNANACKSNASNHSILLATAQVTVIGPFEKQSRVRVLLDQGSEATFVSESLVQILGLKRDRVMTSLSGIGGCTAGTVKHATSFTLKSNWDAQFEIEVNAFVLPRLTSELPSRSLVELELEPFKTLPLADPDFHISDKVDILIGADLYGQLLRPGLTTFPRTALVAQNTALGWVISGPTKGACPRRAANTHTTAVKVLRCAVSSDLSDVIERFWTVEEVPVAPKTLKPQDEACERLFAETHTRNSDGRFQVKLPVKSNLPLASDETRKMAFGSLQHQLRRFSREPDLARAYTDFMDTYLKLGHMEPVPRLEIRNPRAWYLPHHAVISGAAEKLKIRVVFDASRRTRDKHCLNEFLMPGPALQSDLSLILLNWRRYKYVFTADIVKMFRQIQVAREDQDLQRILWSPQLGKPAVDYRLTTVTYGTACAPYLAIRTLYQLALDEKDRFPLGAACLESDTYVDDTFAGADDLAMAVRKRDELIGILESAGITLDKWAANHPKLLPAQTQSNNKVAIKEFDRDNVVKTLGVHWNPSCDKFSFGSSASSVRGKPLTKRSVYSDIARLFDPLGWLAPVTVTAKVIMQDLWIEKCEWDEPLTDEVRCRWQNYCGSLTTLHTLSINRWLGLSQQKSFEIHGFSDASSRAYAAVVYLRIDNGNENYHVSLLSAKTKVAPVKTVSIPNLELCGATLLVKLVVHLQKLVFLQNVPVRLWSDSQIVLTWLKKHPCSWKTFVANRVSLIQTELPSATWAHVPTKQNPADLATRGATPDELRSNELWWTGPKWLISPSDKWPQSPKPLRSMHASKTTTEPALLSRYSNLTQLLRITAWCLRPFLQKIRKRAVQGSYPAYLTTSDLANARDVLVKLAQSHAFSSEIGLLQARKSLPKHNHLCKLRPFVDTDGILRVGGRLNNAKLPHHLHYPAILPRDSALSRLFVSYAHERAYHGGPTLTISILLRFAWIVNMRALVKSAIRRCVKCQRHAPRLAHQLMGDLPAERVVPARPFTNTGLDYAGPFQLRASKGRGRTTYKGYIALFVCFATKALHLEVVGDLTTAAFLAAYRRFVSRRGLCKKLFSDNATTFHGADAELRGMFKAASSFYTEASSLMANDGTEWIFIPPTTPHYGGLWEAGVKSTKNLLRKLVGERTLSFEEFSTVLAEIEACLNSRPLCQMTADPEDLQALTPAHFLIGAASGVIPDEATPSVPENRLDRFQLLQRIRDQFWKRWSTEYVLLLQERNKWRDPTDNFAIGQLVVMKDDRYPPAKWPLGRVLELHAGADGHVRVVTVKTATNTLRRHIACLAPLNLHQPEDQEETVKRGK